MKSRWKILNGKIQRLLLLAHIQHFIGLMESKIGCSKDASGYKAEANVRTWWLKSGPNIG